MKSPFDRLKSEIANSIPDNESTKAKQFIQNYERAAEISEKALLEKQKREREAQTTK